MDDIIKKRYRLRINGKTVGVIHGEDYNVVERKSGQHLEVFLNNTNIFNTYGKTISVNKCSISDGTYIIEIEK